MTTTTTGLKTFSLVCVPTVEQDKAVAFYESLGFEKRTDQPFGGGFRWIEVYPPEGTAGIALAPRQQQFCRVEPVVEQPGGVEIRHARRDPEHRARIF